VAGCEWDWDKRVVESSPVFVGLMYENIVDDEPMPWPPGDDSGGVDG